MTDGHWTDRRDCGNSDVDLDATNTVVNLQFLTASEAIKEGD